eukprot:1156753-Pelagomonas_calceolata.AAC.4
MDGAGVNAIPCRVWAPDFSPPPMHCSSQAWFLSMGVHLLSLTSTGCAAGNLACECNVAIVVLNPRGPLRHERINVVDVH